MRVVTLVLPALVAAGALAACATTGAGGPRGHDDRVTRGQYLVSIMDCGGCHTPGALAGAPDPARRLAGSDIGFGTPGGIVYPPNLTPDPETGLGQWTDEEIVRAVKRGQGRDGRALVPVMPWPSYAVLTDEDARALVAYLRTLAPVRLVTPRRVAPGQRPAAPYLTIVPPPGS